VTRLQPGCFGKIPLFADFVRHGPPVAELQVLDQWLQEGIVGARQKLGASWESTFEAAPPGRFVHHSRASGRLLGGVYVASRDKAGRQFPFLIYAALEARPLRLEPHLWPVLFGGFMDRAADLAAAHGQSPDLKAYLARMEESAVEVDPDAARRRYQEFLARETNRSFWTALLGPPADAMAVAAKYAVLQNLADTVGAGAIPRYALRFPAASGDLGLAFWLELCGRLEKRLGPPTLAAWDAGRGGGPAGSTVIFDELLSKYFVPVFWPDRPCPQLFPLVPAGAVPTPRLEEARKRFGSALQDPALPLSQVLQRLAR